MPGWRSHLGQVSQRRSLPAQLIQDAAVKGLLLRAAAAQLRQVGVIQTGPVLREGLGTVSLNLSTSNRENRGLNRNWMSKSESENVPEKLQFTRWQHQELCIGLWPPTSTKLYDVSIIRPLCAGHVSEVFLKRCLAAQQTPESNQVPGCNYSFSQTFASLF